MPTELSSTVTRQTNLSVDCTRVSALVHASDSDRTERSEDAKGGLHGPEKADESKDKDHNGSRGEGEQGQRQKGCKQPSLPVLQGGEQRC
eukprot:851049-Rhodomonas_salina.1